MGSWIQTLGSQLVRLFGVRGCLQEEVHPWNLALICNFVSQFTLRFMLVVNDVIGSCRHTCLLLSWLCPPMTDTFLSVTESQTSLSLL